MDCSLVLLPKDTMPPILLRKISQITTKPRNLRKFSPSKVSSYTVCVICSFYYGDMERKYLPKVEQQDGVRMHMCRLNAIHIAATPCSQTPPQLLVTKCVKQTLCDWKAKRSLRTRLATFLANSKICLIDFSSYLRPTANLQFICSISSVTDAFCGWLFAHYTRARDCQAVPHCRDWR